jgi:enoyl-CoA hydratase
MEWALTGGLIDADEAYHASLVTHLTDPGGALDKALEIATRIVANGPMAVRATKKIIVQSQDWTLEESFHRQREITEPIRESDDAKEGAQAFTQKRPPVWQGK